MDFFTGELTCSWELRLLEDQANFRPVAAWLRPTFLNNAVTSNSSNITDKKTFDSKSTISNTTVVIGADPKLLSATLWLDFQQELTLADHSAAALQLRPTAANLIDRIWPSQPSTPTASKEVFAYELRWAGESWQDKVQMWASVTVFVTANDVERCVC
jgi:hypothetical protein